MPDNLESFTESDLAAFVESDLSAKDAGGVFVTHRKYSADDPPEITWNADHGFNARALSLAPDGSVYVVGFNKTTKWSSGGVFQWSATRGLNQTTSDVASGSSSVYPAFAAGSVEQRSSNDGTFLAVTNGIKVEKLGDFVYTIYRSGFIFGGGSARSILLKTTEDLLFVWSRTLPGFGPPLFMGKSDTHIYVCKYQADNSFSGFEVHKVATDSTVVWTLPIPREFGVNQFYNVYGFAVAPDGTSYVIDDQGNTASDRVLRVAKIDNSGVYQGTSFTIPDVAIPGSVSIPDQLPLYAENSGDLYGIVSDESSWGKWDSSGTVQFEIDTNVHARQRIYDIFKDDDGNHYAAGTRVIDPF